MEYIKLKDLCEKEERFVAPNDDAHIDYVDISSVDNKSKSLTKYDTYIFAEAPSRARKRVKHGDVIVSTVRPNLNAVARFNIQTPHTPIASTGFCVLRHKSDVDPIYIYFFCISPNFVRQMVAKATGASYPAVSDTIVREAKLPKHTAEKRVRIVSTLSKAKEIIEHRRAQLAKLDELVKCRFVELFGITNEYARFPVLRLHELCKNADDIKCGPFGTQLNKEEYQTAGVPIWEIPQINSNFAIPPVHFISNEKAHLLRFYDAVSGDIIMSRKGKVGMCTIFPNNVAPGVIHSDVLRIRLNEEKASNIFICALFRYSWDVENQLARISMGAIMPGVNVTKLKQLQVIVPPLNLQQTFAVFVRRIDKLRFFVGRV